MPRYCQTQIEIHRHHTEPFSQKWRKRHLRRHLREKAPPSLRSYTREIILDAHRVQP